MAFPGAAKRPLKGRDAGLRKIDNFLPSRLGAGIVFQKCGTSPARSSHGRRATWAPALKAGERLGNGAASDWNRLKRTRRSAGSRSRARESTARLPHRPRDRASERRRPSDFMAQGAPRSAASRGRDRRASGRGCLAGAKLRKRAAKPMKSLTRVNLCAGAASPEVYQDRRGTQRFGGSRAGKRSK